MGDHFPAGKFFTMLLVVPNGSKEPVRALVPRLAQADRRGNIVLHFRMPIVTRCGSAWMYVFAVKTRIQVRAPVTLTRCTAPAGQKVPPPPPKP